MTGTLTFSDPDAPVTVTGVAAGNVGSVRRQCRYQRDRQPTAILHVNADGSYTYTLTSPFDTTPDANNGPNTETAAGRLHLHGDGRPRQHRDLDGRRSTSSTTFRRRRWT